MGMSHATFDRADGKVIGVFSFTSDSSGSNAGNLFQWEEKSFVAAIDHFLGGNNLFRQVDPETFNNGIPLGVNRRKLYATKS
jgi:hypothetical protein